MESALGRDPKWFVDTVPLGRDTAEIEAEMQLKENCLREG
jgi:hypothetical protein